MPRTKKSDNGHPIESYAHADKKRLNNPPIGLVTPDTDRGVVRKYRPDFLIRLTTGDMLILETKGQDTEQDRVKWKYLEEWVQAVNQQGGFGRWRWDVAKHPGDVLDILTKHSMFL